MTTKTNNQTQITLTRHQWHIMLQALEDAHTLAQQRARSAEQTNDLMTAAAHHNQASEYTWLRADLKAQQ